MKKFRKNNQGFFVCEECDVECKIKNALSHHINKFHNIKSYYDKWIREKDENICQVCGNETKFIFLSGYKNTCSDHCAHILSGMNQDQNIKKQKYKQTCLEKYGVENTFQADICKEKIEQTNLERYGYAHNFSKESSSRKKWQNRLLKEEGITTVFQRKAVKEKIKQTNLRKYGHENIAQGSKKELIKLRYGVEHVLQNKEIHEKQQRSCFRIKQFKETGIWYQASYELDFLEKYYIKYPDIQRGKSIKYLFNGKNKIYHSDFYIPSLNLIIEIKNSYLFEKYKEQNISKKEATIAAGFNYKIIINKNYDACNL